LRKLKQLIRIFLSEKGKIKTKRFLFFQLNIVIVDNVHFTSTGNILSLSQLQLINNTWATMESLL
jgi:hypothetical protein